MKTFTGRFVDPLALQVSDIDVVDIAHALANICRYGGHSKWHYSVAQHSVYVEETLRLSGADTETRLKGLFHDAPEAYLGDIPRPMKVRPEFDWYHGAEDKAMSTICKFLNVSQGLPPEVKVADNRVAVSEGLVLMHEAYRNYGSPAPVFVHQMPPQAAKDIFLERYAALLRKHVYGPLANLK